MGYVITAKIEHGIPIVIMKSNAGFTSHQKGRSLSDAYQKAFEECLKQIK